jgi:hypothetical protein
LVAAFFVTDLVALTFAQRAFIAVLQPSRYDACIRSYESILLSIIKEFHISGADDKIRGKLEAAKLMAFAADEQEARQILREATRSTRFLFISLRFLPSPLFLPHTWGSMDAQLEEKLIRIIVRHEQFLKRVARMLAADARGDPMPADAEFNTEELKSLDSNTSDLCVELTGGMPLKSDWAPPVHFAYEHGYAKPGAMTWLTSELKTRRWSCVCFGDAAQGSQRLSGRANVIALQWDGDDCGKQMRSAAAFGEAAAIPLVWGGGSLITAWRSQHQQPRWPRNAGYPGCA